MQKQLPSHLAYIIVIATVILSKSLYYESFGKNVLLIFALITLAPLATTKYFKTNGWHLGFCAFSVTLAILSLDPKSSAIAVLISRLTIACFVCALIPFKQYSRYFSNTILFIGLVSLLSFPLFVLKVQSPLPNFTTIDDRTFNNFVIFGINKSATLFHSYRNSGLWWEPGAFSTMLSISLIFDVINRRTNPARWLTYAIITISTLSTTGLISLALSALINFQQRLTAKKLALALPPVMLCGLIALYFTHSKITEAGSIQSFSSRFNDNYISLKMLEANPIRGYGFGSQIENAIPFGENLLGYDAYHFLGTPTGADGLMMLVAQTGLLGIILIIPILIPRYAHTLSTIQRSLLTLNLLCVFNTQNFTYILIFSILSLYGVQNWKRGKETDISANSEKAGSTI